jgi:hypothetical protein
LRVVTLAGDIGPYVQRRLVLVRMAELKHDFPIAHREAVDIGDAPPQDEGVVVNTKIRSVAESDLFPFILSPRSPNFTKSVKQRQVPSKCGICLPGALFMYALSLAYHVRGDRPMVTAMLRGVAAAAVGLILAAVTLVVQVICALLSYLP